MLGRMQVPLSELNRMSLREIFLAISGFSDLKRQEFAVMYDIAKYHASRTAFSKEQVKRLRKDDNPFVDKEPSTQDKTSFDEMLPFLKQISKRKN